MKHFRGTRDGFVVRVGKEWLDKDWNLTGNLAGAFLYDDEGEAQSEVRDLGKSSVVVAATLKIHAITEDQDD